MPLHEWSMVPSEIFHSFHLRWISELVDRLNDGLLPKEYYALAERWGVESISNVISLNLDPVSNLLTTSHGSGATATAVEMQAPPQTRFVMESDDEAYLSKQRFITIRHTSGDRIVAAIELVSPGNKSSTVGIDSFVEKSCDLLKRRIHLTIIDPYPPGARDPSGLHGEIWKHWAGDPFDMPGENLRTLASYECGEITLAYIDTPAAGEPLPDMPLFLAPRGCIMLPLEATYTTVFGKMPLRWKQVLEPSVE